jgi:hypothetical protein
MYVKHMTIAHGIQKAKRMCQCVVLVVSQFEKA